VTRPSTAETPSEGLTTVVVTTRNRTEMAHRAVRSSIAQTVPPSGIVVVDDGSQPLFELEGADPRITLVRLDRPRGVCAARNAGLARASGRWVTFLDDDDELVPEMLEISLAAAARSRLPAPVAVLSGVETLRPDGSTGTVRLPVSLPRGRDYFLDGGRATVGNTLFVPREILTRLGGFDRALRSAEHSELLLRLNAACSIEGVPTVTYRIKRHEGEHLHSDPLARASAMERTERKHRAAFGRHRRRHAEYLSATGIWYLKGGRWGAAIRATSRGLVRDPLVGRVVGQWLVALAGPVSLAVHRQILRPLRSRRPH
jgi:glycosyltransferase involved in cell wall biosynthesis